MKKTSLLLIFVLCLLLVGMTQWEKGTAQQSLQLSYQEFLSDTHGFKMDIFNNLEFSGYPKSTHQIKELDLYGEYFEPLAQSPISATVQGFLYVDESGRYSFELASDDGSLLYLDGQRVLENWGFHSYQAKKRTLYLIKGWHFVLIKYQNQTGAAGLKLAWGRKGEIRKPVSGSDVVFPENLPFKTNPFKEPLAGRLLVLNQIRSILFLSLVILIIQLFVKRNIFVFIKDKMFWLAAAVFSVALSLRLIHYFENIYLRIHGIMDGGDNHYFMMLPIHFVTSGEFISLKCGNLGILIPLVGLFYKYFHFFPGIHYFSLFMVFTGSLLCLFPWLLLRKTEFGWAGLLGGLFLALNPLLVQFDFPYVSSDPIGLFLFSLSVTLGVKALSDNKWSSYLLAGIAFGLLPVTRTVYIPSAPVFALLLVVFGKERFRAAVGLACFGLIMLGYEFLARLIVKQPYYLYFIHDGYGATVVHRASDQPHNLFQMVLWLPRFLWDYAKLMFEKLVPEIWGFAVLKWIIAGLFVASLAALACKKARIFLFIFLIAGIYLFEISSYHLHGRLTLPVVYLIGFVFALGLKEGFSLFSKSKFIQKGWILIPVIACLGLFQAGIETKELVQQKSGQNRFYKWAAKQLPDKSIIVTDHLADPWEIYNQTKLPVLYEAKLDQSLVVNRSIVPIEQVCFLADQSQIPNFKKYTPEAQFFRHHPYVLDGLAQKGYRYFILQKGFARQLKEHDFKYRKAMSFNEKHYSLNKLADYPKNSEMGIWELERNKEPLEQECQWNPPPYPENLDRFLKKN